MSDQNHEHYYIYGRCQCGVVQPNYNEQSELAARPCPFCGSAAKVFTREIHDTTPEPRRKLYWYVCSSPQCGVGLTRGEWSEARALEKWNTRFWGSKW